jgi:hypothetical protein
MAWTMRRSQPSSIINSAASSGGIFSIPDALTVQIAEFHKSKQR